MLVKYSLLSKKYYGITLRMFCISIFVTGLEGKSLTNCWHGIFFDFNIQGNVDMNFSIINIDISILHMTLNISV